VFGYVKNRIADGFAPTRAEISREFGWASANAAEDHLRALERKGLLKVLPGTARGIVLHSAVDTSALKGALAELDRWKQGSYPREVPFNEVLTRRAAALEGLVTVVRGMVG
jgi:SOS-response transcriptional repressor LexA